MKERRQNGHTRYTPEAFLLWVFLISLILKIIHSVAIARLPLYQLAIDPSILALSLGSVVFLAAAHWKRLSAAKGIFLLAVFPPAMCGDPCSGYGLGFFACGVAMLYSGGHLKRYRVAKLIALSLFLFCTEVWIISANLSKTLSLTVLALALLHSIFTASFTLFLFLVHLNQTDLLHRDKKPSLSLSGRGLSVAEAYYVKAMADGETAKEIANKSFVSESTVRNTLSRVYRKLEVSDKASLMILLSKYDVVD